MAQKGPTSVPSPPKPRLPISRSEKPISFTPPVAAGPRIKPMQTRDYAKQTPVGVGGFVDGNQP